MAERTSWFVSSFIATRQLTLNTVRGGRSIASGEYDGLDVAPTRIEATLPRADQDKIARSRKASHALGLFKRTDTAKEKHHDNQATEHLTSVTVTYTKTPDSEKHGFATPLPAPLLRSKTQELQPAFSLPKPQSAVSKALVSPLPGPGQSDGASEQPIEQKEHISSAVYYPHEAYAPHTGRDAKEQDYKVQINMEEEAEAKGASEDPTLAQSHGGIELELLSENENLYLHGNLPPATVDLYEQPPQNSWKSELVSSDNLMRQDEHTLSTSPKMLPPQSSMPMLRHSAVALTRFSHQVGGHTILYQVSDRAVLKKLNNKENKFYETIERCHPDLLEFMPRSVFDGRDRLVI